MATKQNNVKTISKPMLIYRVPSEWLTGLTEKQRKGVRKLRNKIYYMTTQYDTIQLDKSVYMLMNEDDVKEIDRRIAGLKEQYAELGFDRVVLYISQQKLASEDFEDNFIVHFLQKLGDMIEQMEKEGGIRGITLQRYEETIDMVEDVKSKFDIDDKKLEHLLVIAKDKLKEAYAKEEERQEREWV